MPIFNISRSLWNERVSVELNFSLHRHSKGFLDEKIGNPILISVNYNDEMSKKSILEKIFRFLTYVN